MLSPGDSALSPDKMANNNRNWDIEDVERQQKSGKWPPAAVNFLRKRKIHLFTARRVEEYNWLQGSFSN
jgi:hypothetical protein